MTEEVKRGPPPKAVETVDCIILRDYWVTADDRRRAGTRVTLPVMEAFEKVEQGLVRRA